MSQKPYPKWPVFRRSVVAAFQRSLTIRRSGTTIVTADDPRVDTILVADDQAAVMLIDCGATLISSPPVSQCR